MILKIVEGVFSKDTFHVAKTAVDLSIFSQLPFFNNYFLKLSQKLKKPQNSLLCFFSYFLLGIKGRFKQHQIKSWLIHHLCLPLHL